LSTDLDPHWAVPRRRDCYSVSVPLAVTKIGSALSKCTR
jgi:hypothetical protein